MLVKYFFNKRNMIENILRFRNREASKREVLLSGHALSVFMSANRKRIFNSIFC